MTKLLEESVSFNEDQETAVEAGHGTYKVLAGPGSGKTAVLVARYKRLREYGFHPVCLTFTKAAANEMKERAGGGNFRTIHSMAYKILKDAESSGDFIAPPLSELVPQATDLLADSPYDFQYVMVDEAQDCSAQDWDFISRLSHNIFAVGDAAQCVFGFRKSRPELFLNMEQLFPETRTILMGRNFRSTQAIVNFCKKIAPIRGDLLEKLCTENEQGDPVEFLSFPNNVAEAETVILQAEELRRRNDAETIAVLARTNRQLRNFEQLGAPDYLELSTIHAAKGKEWDNVFIVGAQQGLIPYKDGDAEEEGRILFVAASRAKCRLFLSRYGTGSIFLSGKGWC